MGPPPASSTTGEMDVPQADNVRHNVDVATVDVSVQTVEPVESDSAEVAQIARTQIAVTNRTGGMQMRTATRRTTRRKPVDSMVHSDCNAESCKQGCRKHDTTHHA